MKCVKQNLYMDEFIKSNVWLMMDFMSYSNKLLRHFYSSFYLLPTKDNVVNWLLSAKYGSKKDMNFRITWHRLKFTAWVFIYTWTIQISRILQANYVT